MGVAQAPIDCTCTKPEMGGVGQKGQMEVHLHAAVQTSQVQLAQKGNKHSPLISKRPDLGMTCEQCSES